jgi:hypothetical protein
MHVLGYGIPNGEMALLANWKSSKTKLELTLEIKQSPDLPRRQLHERYRDTENYRGGFSGDFV